MNFKLLLEDLLNEVSKKDVLTQKLGLNDINAGYVYSICGPFSVFIADKAIKKLIEHQRNYNPDFTREDVIKNINANNSFVSLQMKSSRNPNLVDVYSEKNLEYGFLTAAKIL